MAASGSGTAGRKGRGTVGARVPTVRQANVPKRLVALNRDTCLSIEPRAWLIISDIAISTSKLALRCSSLPVARYDRVALTALGLVRR